MVILVDFLVKTARQMIPNYSPSVIIDAGSRDLCQSIEFANEFPNAKIIAFEPTPQQYQYCLERSKQYPNITVLPYAVSDKNGEATFYVTPSNIGASSLLEPIDVPWGVCEFDKIKVQTVRLEDVLKDMGIQKVDILLMDVQGGELAALRGYGSYINNTDFVECEASKFGYYKDHPLCPELEKYFDENNFTHSFHLPFEGPPHKYIEGELVCINKRLLDMKESV